MPETGPTLTAAWKFGAGKTQSHSLNFHSHERVRKGKKKKLTFLGGLPKLKCYFECLSYSEGDCLGLK